jgi:hypothetical protein
MVFITRFIGEYFFLSNFYKCDMQIDYGGYIGRITTPTVEHAYQAMKCVREEDKLNILNAPTPSIAKDIGRKVELIDNWDSKKLVVMQILLVNKFIVGDNDLFFRLRNTKDATLIEGNYWHDNYWGRCFCSKCCGKGENHLGKLLMELRDDK